MKLTLQTQKNSTTRQIKKRLKSSNFFSWQNVPLRLPLVILLGLSALSCSQQEEYTQSHDDHGLILVGENSITLTSEHIASIKSELYQPSLTLYGQLSPAIQKSINLPNNSQIFEISVKEGQTVNKGDTLFTYRLLDQPAPASTTATKPASTETQLQQPQLQRTQSQNDKGNKTNTIADTFIKDVNNAVDKIENDIENIQQSNTTDILAYLAPFKGVVNQVYYPKPTKVTPNAVILKMQTPDLLKFVATLPSYTKPRLSIGQHVNLAIVDNPSLQGLTGQISKIVDLEDIYKIAVHVQVLPQSTQPDHDTPKIGAQIKGKVDYGQMAVGTLVSEEAIHEADLSVFVLADAQVSAPVQAHVWIVNQDRVLVKQAVEVISYDQKSQQYLVAGIPSECLIVLANLPQEAEGKILKIS